MASVDSVAIRSGKTLYRSSGLTNRDIAYIVDIMQTFLSEFEFLVLAAAARLAEDAYAVTILHEITSRTGRKVSRGSVYVTLDRLTTKGLLKSRLGEPTAERGGKAKRYYTLTARGVTALQDSKRAILAMVDNLDPLLRRS